MALRPHDRILSLQLAIDRLVRRLRRGKAPDAQQLSACGEDALQLSSGRPLDLRSRPVGHGPARSGESGLERQRAALGAKEQLPRGGGATLEPSPIGFAAGQDAERRGAETDGVAGRGHRAAVTVLARSVPAGGGRARAR